MSRIREAVETILALQAESYEEFKKVIAELLAQVNSKAPFGTELYDAIARLSYSISFEAVALRTNGAGKTEVYLSRRSPGDTAYPGEWHAPGTVRRPYEETQNQVDRLNGEFGVKIVGYTKVEGLYVTDARSPFLCEIYLVSLDGQPREDDRHGWFALNQLPQPIVNSHEMEIIPRAQKMFESLMNCQTRMG